MNPSTADHHRDFVFEVTAGQTGNRDPFFRNALTGLQLADRWPIEISAVRAIEAGCDALLICRREELQDRAVDALAKRASEDAAFEARVREARDRFVAMRRRAPPKPVRTRAEFDAASEAARAVEAKL